MIPRGLRPYLVSIAAAVLSLALTGPTTRIFGGAYLYFPLIAVFVNALYGGLGPGLVTVALCGLGFDLIYLGIPFRFGISTSEEGHRLAAFVLFGCAASWIAARSRGARHRAEEARREAEAASAEARRVGMQQERLVAIVSHDLRTPLAALSGNVGLLARLGPLTDAQAKVLARMRGTVARMDALIRDILDLARSRHGGVDVSLADVRVGEVCARVVAEARAAHPDVELPLVVEGDDRARLDPERIAQAVSNLVANAIAHGARGNPVRVRVDARDADLAIEVENAGEPIPPELAPSLFEPFRRGRERSSGVGLGLFIVREIARAHGGTARWRSDPGRTIFEIRIPRGAAPAVPVR